MSYYRTAEPLLKGPPMLNQGITVPYGGYIPDVNGPGRPQIRSSMPSLQARPDQYQFEVTESPISPRSQGGVPPQWPNHQRAAPENHRAALEPSIVHREIPYPQASSPGIASPDFRPLHSPGAFGRANSTPHTSYAPQNPPVGREREPYEPRNNYSHSERNSQYPVLQPPIQSQRQEHRYHQPGANSPYTHSPNADHSRSYRNHDIPFPPFQHQDPRRQMAPLTSTSPMHPDPTRSGQAAMSSPSAFSPLHDTNRNSVAHAFVPGGPDAGGAMPPMQSTDYRHPTLPSLNSPGPMQSSTRREQLSYMNAQGNGMRNTRPQQFSPPHAAESNGIPRMQNHNHSLPPVPSAGAPLPSIMNSHPYDQRPPKRQRTDGNGMDSDTEEDEPGYRDPKGQGHSHSPEEKKRKYSTKGGQRPPLQSKRSNSRVYSEEFDEEHLPQYVDGVRVNKEWGLTKAGKARQRLPQACIACRKKKIKCIISKGQTICEKCKQQSTECVFKASTSSRSKGSSAAPESSQTPNKMESEHPGATETPMKLEKRESMDDFKQEQARRRQSTCSNSDDEETPTPETDVRVNGVEPTAVNLPPAEAHSLPLFVTGDVPLANTSIIIPDSSNGDQRDVQVKMMQQQWAESQTRPRANSFTNTHASSPTSTVSDLVQYDHQNAHVPPSRRIYHSAKSRVSTTPVMGTPPIGSVPFPMGDDPRHHTLPSGDILDHLVNLYFTHVYSQHYPFLHRKTFTQDIQRHPPVLLFSLCAIAARFSKEYREAEEEFAAKARHAILDSFDNNCIEVVQAMVLMGLHDFGSNNGQKAWMFAGMAVRMGAALNLNLEKSKGPQRSVVEQEVARRTYWSYYLMDRLNSYGVARPFLTQDHDCHIQLPCDQVSFENQKEVITEHLNGKNPHYPNVGNKNMGAFAYLVRIASIYGNVLKHMHLAGFQAHPGEKKGKDFHKDADFNKFVDQLQAWERELPPGLRYSNDNLGGQIRAGTVGAYVMMHVMFHSCIAYVHRYVKVVGKAADLTDHVPRENLVASLQKVFLHADAVMQILTHVWQRKQEALKNGNQPVTVIAPFIGQAITDACQIAVIRANQVTTEESAEAARRRVLDRLEVGLEWLKELKQYWKPMEGMYDKLRKQCKRFNRVVASDGSASVSPKTQQPLESNYIPSPDNTSLQIRMLQQSIMAPYPSPSLDINYDQSMYDNYPTEEYAHMADIMYSIPQNVYADASFYQSSFNATYGDEFFPGLFLESMPLIPQVPPIPVPPNIHNSMGLDPMEIDSGSHHQNTISVSNHLLPNDQSQHLADMSGGSSNNLLNTLSNLNSALDHSSLYNPTTPSTPGDDDDEDEEKKSEETHTSKPESFHKFFAPNSERSDLITCVRRGEVQVHDLPVDDSVTGDVLSVSKELEANEKGHPPGGADADDGSTTTTEGGSSVKGEQEGHGSGNGNANTNGNGQHPQQRGGHGGHRGGSGIWQDEHGNVNGSGGQLGGQLEQSPGSSNGLGIVGGVGVNGLKENPGNLWVKLEMHGHG